jgi:hypothetical protein
MRSAALLEIQSAAFLTFENLPETVRPNISSSGLANISQASMPKQHLN